MADRPRKIVCRDPAAVGLALAYNAAKRSEEEREAFQRVADAAFKLSDNMRLADKNMCVAIDELDARLEAVGLKPANSKAKFFVEE